MSTFQVAGCHLIIFTVKLYFQFANGFTINHHPREQGDYKLVVYAAKNDSLVGTLSENFAIGEAEFSVEEIITSEYLELDLTHHGKCLALVQSLEYIEVGGVIHQFAQSTVL